MRGFILFFTEGDVNYIDPAHQQLCAAIGEDEEAVAEEFQKTFAGVRRLIGVVSLEEIEHHRDLILRCAQSQGAQLHRVPLG